MKRILSLVLALSMVLSMFTFVSAGSLKDIEGTKYEAAVEALMELGVVNGYPDGTYLPNNVVTRAELAKLLVTAYGLEQAAEVATGATPFSDVPATHWAAGYINVASDYKFVNGYPNGTFAPDATVTYAEAITMCLRVLGYANEVDAKGTWPTNYIAKAQDLKLMKDLSYNSYNDGAQRGNVAILIWNMLRTRMWTVSEESEGDGLVSRPDTLMINVKFSDYEYFDYDLELYVSDIEVEDGKVEVTLDSDKYDLGTGTFELAEGTDFLKLFGRRVAVLYNEEDDVIVMITPDSTETVKEDVFIELSDEGNGDYDFDDAEKFTWGTAEMDEATYTVAVIGSKKAVTYGTSFQVKAGVVDSVKTKNDETTIKFSYGDLATLSDLDEDVIFLLDGEWTTADKVKEGDVVTEFVPGELYGITRKTVKGSFDEVKIEIDVEDGFEYSITVDGKKYTYVLTDEVVEVDEDGEDLDPVELDAILAAKKDDDEFKFYDEDCELYLNYVGQVIRIEFEEIEDIEKVGHFYVLTNKMPTWEVSDKSGVKTYVELDGESYEIKDVTSDKIVVPVEGRFDLEEGEFGAVAYAKFDSKDRVKELYPLPEAADAIAEDYIISVESNDDGVMDDNNYIGEIKVTANTIVYTITPVEDEEDDDVIDHYDVETSKGPDALKGVEYAIVAVEADSDFTRAAYVFVWDDAVSDEEYGIVEKLTYSKGTVYLTIDGTKYEVDDEEELPEAAIVGALVVYVEKTDGTIRVNEAYTPEDLLEDAKLVEKVDGELFTFADEAGQFDLDVFADEVKDCDILLIEASEDSKTDGYKLDSVEVLKDVSDIKVKKNDRIVIVPVDGDYDEITVFFIIRGVDAEY